MRKDFDDRIRSLKQEAEIPEIVQKKADLAFDKIRQEAVGGDAMTNRGKRKISAAFVAAAVLAASALTVSAAAYMTWSRGLEEGLQVGDAEKELLETQEMATPLALSAEDNGVTITAEQSIVDNYIANISFKIEGVTLPEGADPGFGLTEILVDGEDVGVDGGDFYTGIVQTSDGGYVYGDGTSSEDEEFPERKYVQEDGSLIYILTMTDEYGGEPLLNKNLYVKFRDLVYTKTDPEEGYEFGNLAEGVWEFEWTLAGSDQVRTFEPGQELGESGIAVKRIELSPVSMSVTYQMDTEVMREYLGLTARRHRSEGDLYSLPDLSNIGVKMQDGDFLPFVRSYRGEKEIWDTENGEYTFRFAFNRIIDPAKVSGILIQKESIENQEATEENFYTVSFSE